MSKTVYVEDETTASAAITLEVEEVEEAIALELSANHNETFVEDEVELSIEELKEILTSTRSIPIRRHSAITEPD